MAVHIFLRYGIRLYPPCRSTTAPDTVVTAIEDVFNVLYKPFDLPALGDWEWGNRLNAGCGYVVVQSNIYYAFNLGEESDAELQVDTLTDFRPVTTLSRRNVLYLNDTYAQVLTSFLAGEQDAGLSTMEKYAAADARSRL